MRHWLTSVPWFWMSIVIPLFLFQPNLHGQEAAQKDSATEIRHSLLTHHVEAGINALGAGLDYRYQWVSFLSTDAVVSLARPGVGFGITFSPLWIFYIQGVAGTGSPYEEAVTTDGPPPFRPRYLYGWNAGFHIPIAPKSTRLYFIFAVGQLKYVQNHYQYNGGGFTIGPPTEPLYRTETRATEVVSIGFGISF